MIGVKLDPKLLDVLRAILEQGIVRGADLHRATASSIQCEDLQKAIHQLIQERLIAVSGSVTTPADVMRAYFNIQPSAVSWVRSLLAQPI